MKKTIIVLSVIIIVIIGAVIFFYSLEKKSLEAVNSFEDCENYGYQVEESYPRQCKTSDGRNFVEDIPQIIPPVSNEFIKINIPQAGSLIESPLEITGEARGNWYFEASFPITLENGNGQVIAQAIAQAEGNWMTTEFVPFKATLNFNSGALQEGVLIFHKDNPSGLPENDNQIEVPVNFNNNDGMVPQGVCKPTGCSSQICSDEEVVTTCEFLPEYACYSSATCERQSDGECGWTETDEFLSCLASTSFSQ